MKSLDQAKSCSQCEADVSIQATYCPFCGSDLITESDEPQREEAPQEIKESLASLYKPPYSARSQQGVGVPDEREETTFVHAKPAKEDHLLRSYPPQKEPSEASPHDEKEPSDQYRGSLWPLLLLSIGGYLFALGALILLFAKNGVLTLQWQARYWILYWLLGIPFFVLGVRRLKTNNLS